MDDTFTDGVSEEEDQEAEEVDDDGGQSEITAIFCQQRRESAMQGNNSWGFLSKLRWWLPSAVLRMSIHCLAESSEAATLFIRQWPWFNI